MASGGNYDAKANEYLVAAQKKTGLFSSSSTTRDAIDLYIKAANSFKMAKNYQSAGDAFTDAAVLQSKSGSLKHDAAKSYVDASNCFLKTDPNQAAYCLTKAINIFKNLQRMNMVGRHVITLAEIYEKHLRDTEKALVYYEEAANYFEAEFMPAKANKCWLIIAHHAAMKGDYRKAIDIYEKIADQCADHSLLRFSATDHYFRAVLCHMCIDFLDADIAIKRYEDNFPMFGDSRQCKFAKYLLQKIEDEDLEGYRRAIQQYESITRFEHWYSTLLERIKDKFSGEPDLK